MKERIIEGRGYIYNQPEWHFKLSWLSFFVIQIIWIFVCGIKVNVKTLASTCIFAKFYCMVIILCVSPQTSAYFKGTKFSWHGNFPWQIQGRKTPRSYCLGQVNFDLGQIKIEVWSPSHAILFPDRTRVVQTLGTRLVALWAIYHVVIFVLLLLSLMALT